MLLEIFDHSVTAADIIGIGKLMRRQTGDPVQNDAYNPWKLYFNLYLRNYPILIESEFFELDKPLHKAEYDAWASQYDNVKQFITYNKNLTDMDFFKSLHELSPNLDLTLRLKTEGEKISVEVLPASAKYILPLQVTGTAPDLDEGFIEAIRRPMEVIGGLQTNGTEFIASVTKGLDDAAATAAKAAPEEKKSETPAAAPAPKPKKAGDKKVTKGKSNAEQPVEQPAEEAEVETPANLGPLKEDPEPAFTIGQSVMVTEPGQYRGEVGKVLDNMPDAQGHISVQLKGGLACALFSESGLEAADSAIEVEDLAVDIESSTSDADTPRPASDDQPDTKCDDEIQETIQQSLEQATDSRTLNAVYAAFRECIVGSESLMSLFVAQQTKLKVDTADENNVPATAAAEQAEPEQQTPPVGAEKTEHVPVKSTDWVEGEYVRVVATESPLHNMVGKLATHRPPIAGKHVGTLIVEFPQPTGAKIIHASYLAKEPDYVEQPGEHSEPVVTAPAGLSHRELKELIDNSKNLADLEDIHGANAHSIDTSSWLKDLYLKRQKDLTPATEEAPVVAAEPAAAAVVDPAPTESADTASLLDLF